MTITISNAFVAEFGADVKHAYQSLGSGLLSAVRLKNNVQGASHRFHKMGKGLASPRLAQSPVVPMNVKNANVTATLTDWEAPEYTDIYDMEKISYDEKQELVHTVAGAIARRAEQLVLDALEQGANSTQVKVNMGGGNSGLTVAKLRRAKKLMDAAGVPKSDRFFAHSATGLEQLLGTTQATSADYNSVRALVSGDVSQFLGFRFIGIEDRQEGGLPRQSGGLEHHFAFHKHAVGLAVGLNFRTEVNYVPNMSSWLINGLYSAGAVAIDDDGIYRVQSDSSIVV